MSDIISVISPPPPGHTSYPKRKLQKLFSPQLGDEEWLGPLLANVTPQPGLLPVWCDILSLQLIMSCLCRGLIMREMRDGRPYGRNTREKVSSKQFNVCLLLSLSRIHPGCHASCCHVETACFISISITTSERIWAREKWWRQHVLSIRIF